MNILINGFNALINLNKAYYDDGHLEKRRHKLMGRFIFVHLPIDGISILIFLFDNLYIKIFYLLKFIDYFGLIRKYKENYP